MLRVDDVLKATAGLDCMASFLKNNAYDNRIVKLWSKISKCRLEFLFFNKKQ